MTNEERWLEAKRKVVNYGFILDRSIGAHEGDGLLMLHFSPTQWFLRPKYFWSVQRYREVCRAVVYRRHWSEYYD